MSEPPERQGSRSRGREVSSGTQETASSQAPHPRPSLVLGVEGAARLRRAQGVGPPVLPFPAEMEVEGAEGAEAEEVGLGGARRHRAVGAAGLGGSTEWPGGRRQRIWIQAVSLSRVPGQARVGAWLLDWGGTGWNHKDPAAWQGSLLCRLRGWEGGRGAPSHALSYSYAGLGPQ